MDRVFVCAEQLNKHLTWKLEMTRTATKWISQGIFSRILPKSLQADPRPVENVILDIMIDFERYACPESRDTREKLQQFLV